jgi:hypothetical protein
MMYMGWFRELAVRLPALLSEARDRGDRTVITHLNTDIMAHARLTEDCPDAAEAELRQAMDQWSRQGFHLQHHNAVLAQALIHLYQGNGVAAFQQIQDQWPRYKSSLLLLVQQTRIDLLQLRARSALAAAAATGAKSFLHAAEGDARKLARERMPWSDALSRLVLAGIAGVRGDTEKAILLLREAIDRLHAVDMDMFAQAARRRLGQFLGADEGRHLIEESETWMAGQGIRKPARMAATFAPGFSD